MPTPAGLSHRHARRQANTDAFVTIHARKFATLRADWLLLRAELELHECGFRPLSEEDEIEKTNSLDNATAALLRCPVFSVFHLGDKLKVLHALVTEDGLTHHELASALACLLADTTEIAGDQARRARFHN